MTEKKWMEIQGIALILLLIVAAVLIPKPESTKKSSHPTQTTETQTIETRTTETSTVALPEKPIFAAELTKLFDETEGNASYMFIDLTTNATSYYRPNAEYFAASTIKVPIVMMLTDKVASGDLSWTQKVAYTEEDYEEGTGILQNDLQDEYTVKELAEVAITQSDNIAKNMLERLLGGREAVRDYIWQQYLNQNNQTDENVITAKQAATILDYLYQHEEKYADLVKHMQETVFHERLETTLTKDHLAHKIGSSESYIHDIGLFLTDQPYALVVYTDGVGDAEDFISTVSDIVWKAQNPTNN